MVSARPWRANETPTLPQADVLRAVWAGHIGWTERGRVDDVPVSFHAFHACVRRGWITDRCGDPAGDSDGLGVTHHASEQEAREGRPDDWHRSHGVDLCSSCADGASIDEMSCPACLAEPGESCLWPVGSRSPLSPEAHPERARAMAAAVAAEGEADA